MPLAPEIPISPAASPSEFRTHASPAEMSGIPPFVEGNVEGTTLQSTSFLTLKGVGAISGDLASAWLERAERLAGVPKQDGSLWHAYRRKWATERKHHPDTDVAQTGGWSDLSSLKTAYQQADPRTLLVVVTEPTELREGPARAPAVRRVAG